MISGEHSCSFLGLPTLSYLGLTSVCRHLLSPPPSPLRSLRAATAASTPLPLLSGGLVDWRYRGRGGRPSSVNSSRSRFRVCTSWPCMANDVMSYCYSLLVLAGSAIGAFDISSGRNSWWMMATSGGSSGGSVNKPDPSRSCRARSGCRDFFWCSSWWQAGRGSPPHPEGSTLDGIIS